MSQKGRKIPFITVPTEAKILYSSILHGIVHIYSNFYFVCDNYYLSLSI